MDESDVETISLEIKVKAQLKKLMSGLTHKNHKEAYLAYVALQSIGPSALPFIKQILLGLRLSSNAAHKPQIDMEMRHVSGLVSLIHDIDEKASKEVSDELIRRGCHDAIRQRLRSINRMTINNFHQYKLYGITIYEEKATLTSFDIPSLMDRWLDNIPASDLEGINRIYIVGLQNSERYLGWYVPHLASVTIVWNRFQSHLNPLAWLALWLQESVLYHEIGHHVLKHEGGGYDQEKEDTADKYAFDAFFKSAQYF